MTASDRPSKCTILITLKPTRVESRRLDDDGKSDDEMSFVSSNFPYDSDDSAALTALLCGSRCPPISRSEVEGAVPSASAILDKSSFRSDDHPMQRPPLPLRSSHRLATAPPSVSLSLQQPRELGINGNEEKSIESLHYRVVDQNEHISYTHDCTYEGIITSTSRTSVPPLITETPMTMMTIPPSATPRLHLEFRHLTVRRNIVVKSIASTIMTRLHSIPQSDPVVEPRLTIINDISGEAKSGELFAILACSGAGKSTFLNVLAGRSHHLHVDGSLLLNGRRVTPSTLSTVAAYVMQSDVLIPTCTAREHIQFHADMTVPYSRHHCQKDKVNRILSELDLLHCADHYVGISAAGDSTVVEEATSSWLSSLSRAHSRGLSGGEQRRVSIGMSLVHNPSLLFCDEPTSGLDSTTAYSIVRTLKNLCAAGRTVIMTIHSPSAKMIGQFDQMMLLTPNGELAFTGSPQQALTHFSHLGHVCPPTTNAADFCLSVLHGNTQADDDRVNQIVQSYRTQTNQSAMTTMIESDTIPFNSLVFDAVGAVQKPSSAQPFWYQTYRLLQREWQQLTRSPLDLLSRLIQNMILSVFVGVLFINTGYDQRSIYQRIAFIFFSISMIAMTTLVQSVLTFTEQRNLFLRERSNHLYRTTALFAAVTLIELPVLILQAITLAVAGYWMIGLQSDAIRFVKFVLGIVILALASNSLGQLLGACAPSAVVAVMLTPLAIVPFMITSGFFINLLSIPAYLLWLKYLSPHYYVFTALFSNEFGGLVLHCQDNEYVRVWIVNQSYEYCYLTLGEDVLTGLFHIDDNIYPTNILYAFLLFLGYRILALIALRYRGRVNNASWF